MTAKKATEQVIVYEIIKKFKAAKFYIFIHFNMAVPVSQC